MKSVYNEPDRNELIQRVRMLNEDSRALWGKMTVFQMMKHCSLWEEMLMGRRNYPRVFIGRIFGKMALRRVTKDEAPLMRNSPSIPDLIIKDSGNVAMKREKWIALLEEHGRVFNPDFVHPFFGRMNREEMGRMAYKHTDHHLRQFGC